MKVIQLEISGRWCVVDDCHGEEKTDKDGKPYIIKTIPYLVVPDGHGRTASQAESLARKLCLYLESVRDNGDAVAYGLNAAYGGSWER
jgi:hypothetical protein